MIKKFSIVFLCCIVYGCGKQVPPDAQSAAVDPDVQPKSYADLSKEGVLVSVNGKNLTKGMVEDAVSLRRYLFSRGLKRSNPKRVEKYAQNFRFQYPERWIRQMLILDDFKRMKLAVSDSQRRKSEDRYVKVFAHGAGAFDDLARACKQETGLDLVAALNEDLESEIYFSQFSNEWNVTESEISDGEARLKKYNTIAAATNVLIHVRATNILNRVKAGESFAELAKKFSENKNDAQDGGDCGVLTAQDFASDTEMWTLISSLPIGGVSDVVARQDHLEIIKVLGRGDEQEGGDASGRRVAHIWFNLPMFYPEMTREQIRSSFRSEKQTEFQKKLIARLRKNAKIGYPNGEKALPPRPAAIFQ